jgi:hypothetical protein
MLIFRFYVTEVSLQRNFVDEFRRVTRCTRWLIGLGARDAGRLGAPRAPHLLPVCPSLLSGL